MNLDTAREGEQDDIIRLIARYPTPRPHGQQVLVLLNECIARGSAYSSMLHPPQNLCQRYVDVNTAQGLTMERVNQSLGKTRTEHMTLGGCESLT
jgi:hypothetical protein